MTVLTGFLGAGKTTLVRRILSEAHGRRILVIENELGEVGIERRHDRTGAPCSQLRPAGQRAEGVKEDGPCP